MPPQKTLPSLALLLAACGPSTPSPPSQTTLAATAYTTCKGYVSQDYVKPVEVDFPTLPESSLDSTSDLWTVVFDTTVTYPNGITMTAKTLCRLKRVSPPSETWPRWEMNKLVFEPVQPPTNYFKKSR